MMDRELYTRLVAELALPFSAVPHFGLIAARHGVSSSTACSIYHQEVTFRIKKTHHRLRSRGGELAARYLAGEDGLQLCYEAELPPCTVMRVLVEQLPLGISSGKLTELLRQPALLPTLAKQEAWLRHCEAGGADPHALPALLGRLQADIERAVECDCCCSPAADLSRHAAGREHEEKLYECLTAAGIAYWTEDNLRSKGFFKTPDAKLQVPIAVQGRVVNWIDSKATFGDDRTHREYALAQYQKYVNRFGPGLVIYWHGFIQDLVQLQGGEDVLLLDDFPAPQDILMLPRLPLSLAAEGLKGEQEERLQGQAGALPELQAEAVCV